jgi:hypothetical protein
LVCADLDQRASQSAPGFRQEPRIAFAAWPREYWQLLDGFILKVSGKFCLVATRGAALIEPLAGRPHARERAISEIVANCLAVNDNSEGVAVGRIAVCLDDMGPTNQALTPDA